MPLRITSSKSFWAVSALFSLLVLGAAAWALYARVTLYLSEDTVSVSPKPVPLPAAAHPEDEDRDIQEKTATPAPKAAAAPETAKKPEPPARPKAVKTVFEYRNPSAREVSLSASFTKWRDVKMTRSNGIWRTEVYVLPGSYLFHYTVDGGKVTDPEKPRSPVGESVLQVEPRP